MRLHLVAYAAAATIAVPVLSLPFPLPTNGNDFSIIHPRSLEKSSSPQQEHAITSYAHGSSSPPSRPQTPPRAVEALTGATGHFPPKTPPNRPRSQPGSPQSRWHLDIGSPVPTEGSQYDKTSGESDDNDNVFLCESKRDCPSESNFGGGYGVSSDWSWNKATGAQFRLKPPKTPRQLPFQTGLRSPLASQRESPEAVGSRSPSPTDSQGTSPQPQGDHTI